MNTDLLELINHEEMPLPGEEDGVVTHDDVQLPREEVGVITGDDVQLTNKDTSQECINQEICDNLQACQVAESSSVNDEEPQAQTNADTVTNSVDLAEECNSNPQIPATKDEISNDNTESLIFTSNNNLSGCDDELLLTDPDVSGNVDAHSDESNNTETSLTHVDNSTQAESFLPNKLAHSNAPQAENISDEDKSLLHTDQELNTKILEQKCLVDEEAILIIDNVDYISSDGSGETERENQIPTNSSETSDTQTPEKTDKILLESEVIEYSNKPLEIKAEASAIINKDEHKTPSLLELARGAGGAAEDWFQDEEVVDDETDSKEPRVLWEDGNALSLVLGGVTESESVDSDGKKFETAHLDEILNVHSSDDETEPKSVASDEGTPEEMLDPAGDNEPESAVNEVADKISIDNETEAAVAEEKEDISSLLPFLPTVQIENVVYPATCLAKLKKRKDEMTRDSKDHMRNLLLRGNMKNLKAYLRKSLWAHNHHMRGFLWQQTCKYLHKADGNFYEEMEDELYHKRGKTEEVSLPSFVDFDNLPTYHLNTSGIQSIHKILGIIHHTNPDVVYCPTIFALVSVFVHYMTPSDAYNCAYGLLRSKETFIMQTKVTYEASKLVIRDLTKKYAKPAYVNLIRNTKNIDAVFDSWYWWIFSDLPFPHLVCLIDCFILEGLKVFYRAALAILILYTKHSAKKRGSNIRHSTHSELVNSIRQFCREIPFRTDKLLKTGFGIRGLTRKHIKKLQMKHEMYINSHHLHPSSSSHSMLGHRRANSGPTNIHMPSSSIVTQDMLYTVWSWLPPRFAVCQPELLYTSEEHGTSLMTLYTRIEDHQPTLIVIKTTNDEVFGAFCSTYWRDRKHSTKNLSYFGTGETFIFTLQPEIQKYSWVGLQQGDVPNTANMFLAGDNSMLTVGGGHGEAIQLDANLLHCRTEKCDTFHNDPLCAEQDFTCKVVEVYGFV